jgi:uncharacterized membrane protein YhiD involved in acid resistance
MEPLKDFEAQHAVGLVVAVVLGALIGLERQLRSHPAGCHTNCARRAPSPQPMRFGA